MRYAVRQLLWLAPLCVATGCSSAHHESTSSVGAPGTAPIEVREVRFEGLDAAVKENKGKVVAIDFWATWCAPCVKKFPHFVEMHRKYADKGLVCISASMDKDGPAGEYRQDKVVEFLKTKGATFPNFIVEDYKKDDKKLEDRFGLSGGIPYMVIFDRKGNRIWDSDILPRLKDDELDQKVEELLAK
jgi:thiol-disulfide isomerase/thioredoxin